MKEITYTMNLWPDGHFPLTSLFFANFLQQAVITLKNDFLKTYYFGWLTNHF